MFIDQTPHILEVVVPEGPRNATLFYLPRVSDKEDTILQNP